jgi:hypothetical protein
MSHEALAGSPRLRARVCLSQSRARRGRLGKLLRGTFHRADVQESILSAIVDEMKCEGPVTCRSFHVAHAHDWVDLNLHEEKSPMTMASPFMQRASKGGPGGSDP